MLISRILVGIVAIITMVGAVLADVISADGAAQHLFNDKWPPHAKFHDAQYVVMSVLLGLIALVLLLRRRPTKERLLSAAALTSTPWFGMLGAFLFPGTAAYDPEFVERSPMVSGVPGQVFLACGLLVLLAVAALLVLRAGRTEHGT